MRAISQTSFSARVKKYIDYDFSSIAFTHCRLADVKNLKVIEQILALKQELALRQKENLPRQEPGEGTRPRNSGHRQTIDPFPRSAGKPAPVKRWLPPRCL